MIKNDNKPQVQAITTIDKNVVVNAGAGTGKTKVLTDRFLYILENAKLPKNKEVESIVAITFTNKATQEMIERIRKEISKKMDEDPKWVKFYRDMEKANISTIHGFCSKILRENPIEAKIDPYFEIFSDAKSSELLNKSILLTLREYLKNNELFIRAMMFLNVRDINNILLDFKSLYNDIRTLGLSYSQLKDNMHKTFENMSYSDMDIIEIKEIVIELMGLFRKNSKLVKMKDNPMWIEFIDGSYNKENIYDYIELIGSNLGSSKVEVEKQDRLKNLITKILSTKEKDYDWLYYLVIDILRDIDIRYSSMKSQEGGLDYDDLQIKVLELLENEEILSKYQNKYKYFMIDEFQDTNELQKNIFYKLVSKTEKLDRENLFVVGDPKQSIYGFRGADVGVFYDVINDIKTNYREEDIITLEINYRSIDTVMDFVNNVFTGLMEDKYDPLDAFNKDEEELKIEILSNEDLELNENEPPALQHSIYEADLIAKRIKILVDEGYKYGDIALIFRATTRAYIYEEALKKYGIPYYNSSSKLFFKRQEILDIVNTLKLVTNPNDIIATIGFLRSQMVGISDNTLVKVLHYETYDEALKSIDNLNEKEKLNKGIILLEYFSRIKGVYNLKDLIRKILEKTSYMDSVLLKEDGEQCFSNITKFITMIDSYYDENLSSVEAFIDYFESIKNQDEEEAVIQTEDSNVVKIMTIHGSKGLEFPVVFIPELSKRSNYNNNKFIIDKDEGLFINTGIENGRYDFIAKKLKYKEDEESKRVLYVAMTRAEKILILGFQGGNSGNKKVLSEHIDFDNCSIIESLDSELEENEIMPIVKSINKIDSNISINKEIFNSIEGFDLTYLDTYSITQYMVFNDCMRKYFFEYIWKIDIDNLNYEEDQDLSKKTIIESRNQEYEGISSIGGLIKGNIVHEFCNDYRLSYDKNDVLEKAISKFTSEDMGIYKKNVEGLVNNYIKFYNEDIDKIYYEKPFYIKMGEEFLSGFIDRINIEDNKVYIYDFKTNSIKYKDDEEKKEMIEYYTPQLQVYSYAVSKNLNRKVDKASLLFLENNEIIDVDISDSSVNETMKKIEEFISFTNKYQSIEMYKKTNNCSKNCRHYALCNKI